MKILHIEEFFHPNAGYQVNMLARLQAKAGHDVTVMTAEFQKLPGFLTDFFGKENIAAKDARYSAETNVEIIRIPVWAYYSGRVIFNFFKLIASAIKVRPDIAVVHGLDGFAGILFITLSKWLSFPIVVDCHMIDMASKNRFSKFFRNFYKICIAPIIRARGIQVIRVVEDNYIEKHLGLSLEQSILMPLGTDTDYFTPNIEVRRDQRADLGYSEDDFIVLYAGKLDDQKGGKFLGEALKKKFKHHGVKRIKFMIIGTCVGDYGLAVEQLFSQSENDITRINTQSYLDLVRFYQAADLVIFPKQCSMSFFEAQSCGVPVLFEDNNINMSRVRGENAFTFESGNMDDFRQKIELLAFRSSEEKNISSKRAREYVLTNNDFVQTAERFTVLLKNIGDEFVKSKAGYN